MTTICQIIVFGFMSLRPDIVLVQTSSDAACYREIVKREARGAPIGNFDLSNKYTVERFEKTCGIGGRDCPVVP